MNGNSIETLRQRLEQTLPEDRHRPTAHPAGALKPSVWAWIKRDDSTGLGMGGNKLRELDLVLGDALDQGADTLVSGGVAQSNSKVSSIWSGSFYHLR